MFKKNKTTSIPSGFGYKKPSVLKFGGSLTENKNTRTSILNEPTSAGEIITNGPFIGPQNYDSQGAENMIPPETNTAPPPKSKITGALGSDLRKAQYVKKGWAFDDTIKGYNRDGTLTPPPTGSLSLDVNKNLSGMNIDKDQFGIDTTGVKGSDKFASSTLGKSSDSKTTKEVRKEGRKERKTIKSDNTLTKGERRGKLIDSRDKQKKTNKAKRKAGRAIKK